MSTKEISMTEPGDQNLGTGEMTRRKIFASMSAMATAGILSPYMFKSVYAQDAMPAIGDATPSAEEAGEHLRDSPTVPLRLVWSWEESFDEALRPGA